MNDTQFQIVKIILTVLTMVVFGLLIPYIKSKLSASKRAYVDSMVDKAVKAAEFYFKDPKQGPVKKDYVLKFLQGKGIKLDEEELNILIDSILYEMTK